MSVYIKAKNTNLHTYFPESASGKHFQASGMRATDFPHKISSIWVTLGFLKKNFGSKTHEKIAQIPAFLVHPVNDYTLNI
jgi:hypothetical protein